MLRFWRGKGTKAFSLWQRAPLWGNCKLLLDHFKGTKAMAGGNGGNRLHCLREVSGLVTNLRVVHLMANTMINNCGSLPISPSPVPFVHLGMGETKHITATVSTWSFWITHGTSNYCAGLCFCCGALCKDPKQGHLLLIEVPHTRGKWLCSSKSVLPHHSLLTQILRVCTKAC